MYYHTNPCKEQSGKGFYPSVSNTVSVTRVFAIKFLLNKQEILMKLILKYGIFIFFFFY